MNQTEKKFVTARKRYIELSASLKAIVKSDEYKDYQILLDRAFGAFDHGGSKYLELRKQATEMCLRLGYESTRRERYLAEDELRECFRNLLVRRDQFDQQRLLEYRASRTSWYGKKFLEDALGFEVRKEVAR